MSTAWRKEVAIRNESGAIMEHPWKTWPLLI